MVVPDSPCSSSIHRSFGGGAPLRDGDVDGDDVAGDDGDGTSSNFHRHYRLLSNLHWSLRVTPCCYGGASRPNPVVVP